MIKIWTARSTLVIGILFLAALLRLWQIDTIPPGFHFDESFEGLEAWRILTDSTYRPIFLTGNFGVPPLNAYANAVIFGLAHIMGGTAGPTAMRITAAIFGILGVLALYGLAIELRHLTNNLSAASGDLTRNLREMAQTNLVDQSIGCDLPKVRPNPRSSALVRVPTYSLSTLFPLFAAAVLAIMRWHIHFSRMGIEPIIVPLLWTATFWLLLRGYRTGHWPNFIGCGILLAACMYTYQGAWVIPLLMIPVSIQLFVFSRQLSTTSHQPLMPFLIKLSTTATTALLCVAPLAWFFWNQPDLLLLRPQQLNIVGATGSPADSTLWGNLWATLKMFGPLGEPGDLDPRRNIPGAPAINIWLAIPFYLGLLIALWRLLRSSWNPTYAIILFGLIGLVAPGIFSEYAPHFHRIVGAAAPVALLCGIGLDWIYQRLPVPRDRVSSAKLGLSLPLLLPLLILMLAGTTSAQNYFVRWAAQPALYHAFDVGFWNVGNWIAEQPADTPIYLTPRDASHATLAFAWQIQEPSRPAPTTFDGRHIFPLADRTNDKTEFYIVLEQEDFRTRLLLPEVFPDAQIVHEFVDSDGNVDARIYARQPQAQAQRLPQIEWEREVGDGIQLLGYDVQPAPLTAGTVLYLQLHWQIENGPSQDWTIFTHLIDLNNGTVLAGHDSKPGNGSLPTQRWQAGWRILDEYQIGLPADLAPGEYGLAIGLYDQSGLRLPTEGNHIKLGTVDIE